jgi:hypothetical protein
MTGIYLHGILPSLRNSPCRLLLFSLLAFGLGVGLLLGGKPAAAATCFGALLVLAGLLLVAVARYGFHRAERHDHFRPGRDWRRYHARRVHHRHLDFTSR